MSQEPNGFKPSEQERLFMPQRLGSEQFNESTRKVRHDPMRPDIDELAHSVDGIDGPIVYVQASTTQLFDQPFCCQIDRSKPNWNLGALSGCFEWYACIDTHYRSAHGFGS